MKGMRKYEGLKLINHNESDLENARPRK